MIMKNTGDDDNDKNYLEIVIIDNVFTAYG